MKGAIVPCTDLKDQFVSSYFLVEKPDGSSRFILNLKKFNEIVFKQHFKMEDLRTAIELVCPNDYLGTIDIEDAYFFIPINENSRRYLRFRFKNILYEFVCLPFGLSTSPFVFTKIMKVVVKYLRSLGFSSVIYLDDILCIESTYERCLENINQTVNLLQWLGFMVNFRKSVLNPDLWCKFLGFIIDTKRFIIELPEEKRKMLGSLIESFLKRNRCSILEFAQLLGKLISSCPGIEYAWLYTKLLEREKLFFLIINDFNYEGFMPISKVIKSDLLWWKRNVKSSVCKIKDGSFDIVIFTDASTTGWGASNGEKQVFGHWNTDEVKLHINFLELLTIKLALQALVPNITNARILLRVDNTTAISYINKMGGVRLGHFGKLSKEIWRWAEDRKIILLASYIPSKENVVADRLSRIENIDIEWELDDFCFKEITSTFGRPEIDLFASFYNTKCSKFVSWKAEKDALFIDAFTENWSQWYFYAFPPFALVLKTLTKIKRERAQGIVVVPYWQNQPWFPLFEKLLVSKPIIFEPNKNVLLSPCRLKVHPQAAHLSLIVGKLSGKHG